MLWCEHTQGHDWPDYASQTVWDFFTNLPEVAPSPSAPPGGGNDAAATQATANLVFNISVPPGANQPLRAVGTFRYPSYIDSPGCSAPDVVATDFYQVSELMIPGGETGLVSWPLTFPLGRGAVVEGTQWALSLAVYVEGGSNSVIPTPLVDHEMKILVEYVDAFTDIVVPGVQLLAPIPDLCS